MAILAIIVVVLSVVYTTLLHIKCNKTDHFVKSLETQLKSVITDLDVIRNFQVVLSRDYEYSMAMLQRFMLTWNILERSLPPSLQKTAQFVHLSEKVPSVKETNMALLKNLLVDYQETMYELKKRSEIIEDASEKVRYMALHQEFNNMITLISTVSEDSSSQYIEQIFHEMMSSINKIKSL